LGLAEFGKLVLPKELAGQTIVGFSNGSY